MIRVIVSECFSGVSWSRERKPKTKKRRGHAGKTKKQDFRVYLESLPEPSRSLTESIFEALSCHIALDRKHARLFLEDFERAFRYYARTGIDLATAVRRLDASRLGGFYARPPILWYPLDDAAKIYPLSMKRNQMAVFRLSVYLRDNVVPDLLQIALTFTITRFPCFATTVKKGFFWHYLDTAKRRYAVEPETEIPCRPLNVSASGSQSFRVLFYGRRISVEFFHILTDGTGGMVFLKTLTAEYLRLLGAAIPRGDGILDIEEAPRDGEDSNDFPKAEPTKRGGGFIDRAAVQMSGKLSLVRPCRILHFELDSTLLRDTARRRGGSVTAYVLALMFVAHRYATDGREGTVQIQVPVNMRKFYESVTVRNFALYCSVKLPLSEITGIEEILPGIARQLEEKASRAAMNEMMNATVGLVRALRYVPLFIKRPVASLVYGFLGDRVFSDTLSNLGVVTVPAEMAPYVEKFDFILGTAMTNRASCSMVTFGSTTVLSVAKCTRDPSFEEKLHALLLKDGLKPVTKGSELYGN